MPPPVAVDVTVFAGGINVYATNKYNSGVPSTLPNGNNTDQCLQKMTRSGVLTLDGASMTSSCFSNLVCGARCVWLGDGRGCLGVCRVM